MVITDRLKQLIFKQLYKELGNVEIIPYNGSVWFIDRENSYWYFHLSEQGCLYWRYSFFPSFFSVFSLEQSEFEPILSSWVEEVLNSNVSATRYHLLEQVLKVEEVLNSKAPTTIGFDYFTESLMEEVLNSKVSTTNSCTFTSDLVLEDILNHKVSETFEINTPQKRTVKKVLDSKVSTTTFGGGGHSKKVEEVLNSVWVKKALNNTQQNESNR